MNRSFTLLLLSGAVFIASAQGASTAAEKNASAPASAAPAQQDSRAPAPRAEQLVRELTATEKMDLLGGTGFATRAIPRLQIPPFKMSDGPVGVRSPPPSTAYAAGIGLAASWDSTLAEEIGVQMGRDARSRGAQFLLGPGVNIYRAPMNGRNFEYFGEDPLLAARITVGYINGVQSQGVSATVKHFLGNNSEFARNTSDSTIDERALREIYLPAFEAAVKQAHVGAVMSSYNIANGEHMSANAYLIRDVLKKQWGFGGVFMSDWSATHDGVAAANAGLDLEMPSGRFMNATTLAPAVRDGAVSAALIDEKVRRLFGLADHFSWWDRGGPDASIPRYNQAGRLAARKGALEGAVLLKNAKGLLPLDAKRIRNIAVIGPNAHPGVATAGGSGNVPAFTMVSALQGISDRLGADATVTYARGLQPFRVLGMLTSFTTARENGQPGVRVEAFDNSAFSGEPKSTRTERQFSVGSPGFGGDPDFFAILDSLPPGTSTGFLTGSPGASTQPTFERWTGWYSAATATTYSVFVQNAARYRLLIDDEVVIDSSHVPKAALRQVKRPLSAGAHKVVLEPSDANVFGRPFWRVGIVPEGGFVDPLAKQLAARADVVVLAVGFDAEIETEGADREFELPPGQDELIREIAAINPNTVVVVTSGGSVDVMPWLDRVSALLASWYPGQEAGTALAQLLFGDANPSGRLPISWERALADNPSLPNYYFNDPEHPNRIVYREGIFTGYRGYQKSGVTPLFPFGFGLSYTTFKYSNLAVAPVAAGRLGAQSSPQALYTVSFDVTNSGSRAGADVAQIYVGAKDSSVPRPKRELKGFARVQLAPGETRHVTVPLDARAFAYYDVKGRVWRADAGMYSVSVGRSSEEMQATENIRLSHGARVGVAESLP